MSSLRISITLSAALLAASPAPAQHQRPAAPEEPWYKVVHTGVVNYYDADSEIKKPPYSSAFYGQDAHYRYNPPVYKDNGDGTVTDLVTGLTWERDMGEKMTPEEARAKAKDSRLGGRRDWRVPTVKELYSLILFTGQARGARAVRPFIDTRYFRQPLGDAARGERQIDAQTWTSTVYTGRTMGKDEAIFGVNFLDGRIKGYPRLDPRTGERRRMYFRLVSGDTRYGANRFADNGDGTISDLSTGLMWEKEDSGEGLDWAGALDYAKNSRTGGYRDWRLPSAKELHTIVDYSRSPQATGGASISPLFPISEIEGPDGGRDFPYFWTGTTHLDGIKPAAHAIYIAFGEARGMMRGRLTDAHGAGAQRSDPKSGNPAEYPSYFGPQGDLRRVYNHARAVRTIKPAVTSSGERGKRR
ncbi:MAG TPA: DUF1566 domain-containing protein [Elusimicrobia bacterium]|nr:DUF1566 domain-containing protein [Elusimicrobiota bacterium]